MRRIFFKILFLISLTLMVGVLIILVSSGPSWIKKLTTPPPPKLLQSASICDEAIKTNSLDSEPVKIFTGKPAKVDFSSIPEAKRYYTVITEDAALGPNFAGHFNVSSWGCGTGCAGYAIVDSITGKVVKYLPFNEHGNQYDIDLHSRLIIFNPKSGYTRYLGKTLAEIDEVGGYETTTARVYSELIEEPDGKVWFHQLCAENVMAGIYSYPEPTPAKSKLSFGFTVPAKQPKLENITYYAVLKRFSSSGDMRFQWYDLDQQKILNQESLFAWFFALPKNVPDDPEATDAWVKLIEVNPQAIFKIIGTKAEPDCEYYGPDHCIENIDIQKFEIIK